MLGSWLTRVRLNRLRGVNSFDDSFYEKRTEEEWKVLKSHATSKEVKKKKSQWTSEDMLLMQTNVLSAIPECFDLQAPMERNRPRDEPEESRPPRISESVKKKPLNEPYVRSGVPPVREKRRKARGNNEQEQEKRNADYNENGAKSVSPGSSSDDVIHKQPSSNGGSNYTYQKMRSKIKFKTKTKVRKKRSNSAPPLRRSERVEEVTSLTEFRRLETRISFTSYVKRKTPLFSFRKTNDTSRPKFNKLRRTEAVNDIKLCGISGLDMDLEHKRDKNIIHNPIFQDQDDLDDENNSSTSNDSTSNTGSEPDSHVTDKNDDITPNHLKRPPLIRCDHVEEEDELETTDGDDFDVAINLLNQYDTIDSDHEIFRQPIITFDTTHIRRDLYIIDEEPENELLSEP